MGSYRRGSTGSTGSPAEETKFIAMSYDNAGNLTADKDGYEYQYDYENRIVKITKDGNYIAEFAYDGRKKGCD
jgi:hypothetical protein